MAVQICPICSCEVGATAYKQEEMTYCCEPCATGGSCVCGCCEVVETKERESLET